jgi:hypothetical protein
MSEKTISQLEAERYTAILCELSHLPQPGCLSIPADSHGTAAG